jgi:hypothetical protein
MRTGFRLLFGIMSLFFSWSKSGYLRILETYIVTFAQNDEGEFSRDIEWLTRSMNNIENGAELLEEVVERCAI